MSKKLKPIYKIWFTIIKAIKIIAMLFFILISIMVLLLGWFIFWMMLLSIFCWIFSTLSMCTVESFWIPILAIIFIVLWVLVFFAFPAYFYFKCNKNKKN